MKTEQIRVRLTDDETKGLRDLAQNCGLQTTALAGVFVRALRSVAAAGGRVVLPLRLQAEPKERLSLNEPTPSYKGRR
jgi:hypothetical protein